jgi:hypothetical protein
MGEQSRKTSRKIEAFLILAVSSFSSVDFLRVSSLFALTKEICVSKAKCLSKVGGAVCALGKFKLPLV